MNSCLSYLVGGGSCDDTSGDSQLEHWDYRLLSSRICGSEPVREQIEEATDPIRVNCKAYFQQVGDGFGAVEDDEFLSEQLQVKHVCVLRRQDVQSGVLR